MTEVYAKVLIEGIEVTSMLNRLDVIEIDGGASRAVLDFADSDLILADVFHEGLEISIDLGRRDEHGVVFKGIVTSLRASMVVDGPPSVEIVAMSNLILLGLEPKTKRWWNTSLRQVIVEVGQHQQFVPGSISPAVDPMFDESSPLQQIEETDLAFLLRLGETYGSRIAVSHGTGPDRLDFVGADDLLGAEALPGVMAFGDNLIGFEVGFDAYAATVNSDIVSTDPTAGDTVSISETHAGPTTGQWVPDAARIARLGGSAAWVGALAAQSAATRAQLTNFWRRAPRIIGAPSTTGADRADAFGDPPGVMGQSGRGRATGYFQLRPQKRVTLDGVGGRWSGPWYVTSTRHTVDIGRSLYLTTFECVR